ncbi:hypothetical protein MCEMSEM45_00229 [Candidatus Pelagibacterales bacterium]|jgi:hypothetical protein
MKKTQITFFANIKIDEISRLNRFKKSFYSIKSIKPDLWVINIRGKFSKFAYAFLKKNIKKNKLILFKLNSKLGWFYDTRKMLAYIKTELVFIWNEDYIYNSKLHSILNIIKDMHKLKIDQFQYSIGPETEKIYRILGCKETKFFYYKKIDKKINLKLRKFNQIIEYKNKYNKYIISACSILNLKTFRKVVLSNHPPIKRWSKYSPYDFEKSHLDLDFLPITIAFPKNIYLFKDIDYERIGSSVYLENGIYKLKKNYLIFKIIKLPAKIIIIFLRELLNSLLLKLFKKKYLYAEKN